MKRAFLNQLILIPNMGYFFQLASQANARAIRIVLNFVVFSAQKGCLSFYQRIEKENELKDNKKMWQKTILGICSLKDFCILKAEKWSL